MTPHEIFQRMPNALAMRIFNWLHDSEKPLYRATIEALTKPRKLRPVFIERKPRDRRNAWILDAISRKQSDSIAAHILQIWLVGQHSKLLCEFLDGLGIAHDDNGTVDELPPAPPRADLEKVITALLTTHEPEVVAVYLHAFQSLDDKGGWPTLKQVIEGDERFALGEKVAA